jgi:hypothetical protein
MRNATAGTRQNASLQAHAASPAYRDLTFALAEAWLSLARQKEAMDGLLVIWSAARPGEQPALSEPRQQLRRGPDLSLADTAREV